MSSLKTTVSIEGELVDLAEVFKALAAAAAATPRPEPRVSVEPKLHPYQQELVNAILEKQDEDQGIFLPLKDSVKPEEGSTAEPETQEQTETPEQTATRKRTRRTREQIEADRLAQEAASQGLAEVEKLDEAVNELEAQISSLNSTPVPEDQNLTLLQDQAEDQAEEQVDTDEVIAADVPATETKTPNAADNKTVYDVTRTAPAPQPNTTSATVDGTSPFIAELRAFCQRKMLGKPENQVLIKNLLTEFGAAGLSALKEVDKMAFKQRLEALPFK